MYGDYRHLKNHLFSWQCLNQSRNQTRMLLFVFDHPRNTNMAFLRHIVDQDYNRRCNDQIFLSCPSIFFFITPFSYLPRLRDFYISLHRGCVESRSPWCNLLLGLSSVYFGPSACFCQTPFLVLRLCLCLGIHHIPFGSDTGEIINKIFNLRFKGNSKVIAEHGLDCVVLGKQWYICVSDKPGWHLFCIYDWHMLCQCRLCILWAALKKLLIIKT